MVSANPRRRPFGGGPSLRSPKVTGISTSRRKLGISLDYVDLTVPFIENEFPIPGATNIDVSTLVSFDVRDVVPGVDSSTIDVTIEGQQAILNGVFQAGFSGSFTPLSDGYTVLIDPDNTLTETALIQVAVTVADGDGNTLTGYSWSFTTDELFAIFNFGLGNSFEYSEGWEGTVPDTNPSPDFGAPTQQLDESFEAWAGIAVFEEGFEFSDGWPDTLDPLPSPTFSSANYNEPFEFSGSWDETVDPIPTPSFSVVDFNEPFDSGWDGT